MIKLYIRKIFLSNKRRYNIMKTHKKIIITAAVSTVLFISAVITFSLAAYHGKPSVSKVQAKQIAYKHAQVNPTDVEYTTIKLDRELFQKSYEIKFYVGDTEYDYEIDAKSGKIREVDTEINHKKSTTPQSSNDSNKNIPAISKEAAIDIALAKVPGAVASDVYTMETDYDDGRLVYEGKIFHNSIEYEFEIDATTGEITDWSMDHNI